MRITYSNKVLKTKPKGAELGKYFGKQGTSTRIKFKTMECQMEDLETIVANGHTLAYQYVRDDVMGDRKKNYIGTDFIIIDIDSTDLTIDEIIDRTTYKPTIIHTTFSNLTENKNNKYCYHLIYCMDETLYGEDNFNYAFSHFSIGIENLVDQKAKDCHRITFTSNSSLPKYQYKFLGNIYSTSDIINTTESLTINGKEVSQPKLSDLLITKGDISDESNKYNSSISYSLDTKSEFYVKKMNSSSIFYFSDNMKEEEKNLTDKKGDWGLNKKFIYDLSKMNRKEFICTYSEVYDYITFTPPTTTTKTEEGIVYADYRNVEYYELPSLWRINDSGERERKKIEIGGRTTQLYVDINLFLLIKPDITKEHLVYEVVKDVFENYKNTDRQFTNHYILSMINNVWKKKNEFIGHPIPKKFKILRYADGMTQMACVGIVRKLMKDDSIGSVIDINLSIEENLVEFGKMGMKIKKNRLMQFIKDNHLDEFIKSDRQIKEERVLEIVKTNPNTSLRKLAEMCKEQNILVSYETIRKISRTTKID